jgi:hypothetical protein
MKYCSKRIIPTTRPEQVFENGICDACRLATDKHTNIDWSEP